MKHTVKLIKRHDESHPSGRDKFTVEVDGIEVNGYLQVIRLPFIPKVSFGHSGEFTYKITIENELLKKHKDYKDIRISIIKLVDMHSTGGYWDEQYLESKGIYERNKSK